MFPLDLRAELRIGDTWTEVTDDLSTREPVTITVGSGEYGSRTDPGKCSLTLNNRDGRYSPRNPASPYFGLLGRNTPLRISVPQEETYLELDGDPDGYVSTPDTAALDITGDIDIRCEAEIDWHSQELNQTLIGRWTTGVETGWMLRVFEGSVRFNFYNAADGVVSFIPFDDLPPLPTRAALRVTVEFGASSIDANLYWAASLDGEWTLLENLPLGAPAGSGLIPGDEPLRISPDYSTSNPPRHPFVGRGYRFEIRNGVDGPVVASPDFRALTPDTTAFTDSAGLEWTLNGSAAIDNRNYRFTGEVSSWPARWDVSGSDVWTPIEAAGILRRLGQGKKPLASALVRRVPSYEPLAYWPMEEGESATQAYSPVDGVQPLITTGFTYAQNDTLASSGPLPEIEYTGSIISLHGVVPPPAEAITGWQVRWVYRRDEGPAVLRTHMRVLSTGTAVEWFVQQSAAGSRILARDDENADVLNVDIATGSDIYGQWVSAFLSTEQSGSDVRWFLTWLDVGGDVGIATGTFPGTVGRPTGVSSPTNGYATDLEGMALGHIGVFGTTENDAYFNAITAWSGETAADRLLRLSAEESLPLRFHGAFDEDPVAMGAQRRATLLELLQECADADGGILCEQRDGLSLLYRARATLYNQTPRLALDYTARGEVAPPLEPVDDDSAVRNDITVQRAGGSSGRAVLEEGPLSVQAPPDGVGLYDETVTLNLEGDDQTEPIAYWRLHLGTWDEARYPVVHVNLAAAPHLVEDVLALRLGDKLAIANPPVWLPPESIEQLVQGYTETLSLFTWDLEFTCTPGRPWTVGEADDEDARVDTDGSELAEAADAGDTTLVVHSPLRENTERSRPWMTSAGPNTNYPGDFPVALLVGGEEVSVTACEPYAWDTFTRVEAGTWGTASSGHAWSTSGGLTTDRSIDGTSGVVTLFDSPSSLRLQYMTDVLTDCEVLVAVTPGQVSTGAALLPSALLRVGASYYRMRLRLETSGAVGIEVVNETTAVGPLVTTDYTYAAGTTLWLRARIVGQRALGRVWPDGMREPHLWQADQTVTTATIAAGGVGVSASSFGGNTNTDPVLRFDNFQVVTPQRMTAVRSVNGIVKAHAAATDVRLARPTYVAL